MNGNRMKYASTPTYGMQKRGLSKKSAEKQPQTPDFSQTPDLDAQSTLPPAAFIQPSAATPGAAFPQAPAAYPQSAGVFAQGANRFPQTGMPQTGMGVQQGMPQTGMGVPQGMPQTGMGVPHGMPQTGMGVPQGGMQQTNPYLMANTFPFTGMGAYPAAQTMPGMVSYPANQAAPMVSAPMASQPPVGTLPLQQQVKPKSNEPFSPRAQGYIPPQQPVATNRTIPASSFVNAPQATNPSATPAPQAFAPLPYNNPALGGGMMGGPNGTGFNTGMPLGSVPNQPGVGYPTDMIYPGYAQQAPQQAKKPASKDLWVKLCLFALLPFLLLLGLLVPALDFLRYVFVIAGALSMVMLWVLHMFQQSTRSAITIIYVALCCVALFAGGSRDAQQVSASGRVTPSPEPTAVTVVMDGTLEPSGTEAPPEAEALGTSEAELRLSTFMDFWSASRVEDMVGYVQPSWATLQDAPAQELFTLLGNRTPEDYTIEAISGTNADTSRTVTMTATINKNNGKDPVMYRFMILMIKEDGNWYVDPNSLASNDTVTADPNATPTVGNMTAAPRTTVTPTPAPETPLYYNPDGGSYYHTDQYCPSVKDEFLPLPASFPYSELSAHSDLQPCLKCGAPTE